MMTVFSTLRVRAARIYSKCIRITHQHTFKRHLHITKPFHRQPIAKFNQLTTQKREFNEIVTPTPNKTYGPKYYPDPAMDGSRSTISLTTKDYPGVLANIINILAYVHF